MGKLRKHFASLIALTFLGTSALVPTSAALAEDGVGEEPAAVPTAEVTG